MPTFRITYFLPEVRQEDEERLCWIMRRNTINTDYKDEHLAMMVKHRIYIPARWEEYNPFCSEEPITCNDALVETFPLISIEILNDGSWSNYDD